MSYELRKNLRKLQSLGKRLGCRCLGGRLLLIAAREVCPIEGAGPTKLWQRGSGALFLGSERGQRVCMDGAGEGSTAAELLHRPVCCRFLEAGLPQPPLPSSLSRHDLGRSSPAAARFKCSRKLKTASTLTRELGVCTGAGAQGPHTAPAGSSMDKGGGTGMPDPSFALPKVSKLGAACCCEPSPDADGNDGRAPGRRVAPG